MNSILSLVSDLHEPLNLDFWTGAGVRILELLDYFLGKKKKFSPGGWGRILWPEYMPLNSSVETDSPMWYYGWGFYTVITLFGSETIWTDWRETVRSCLDFYCEDARGTILEAENSLFLTPVCRLLHPGHLASRNAESKFLSFTEHQVSQIVLCVCVKVYMHMCVFVGQKLNNWARLPG